MEFLTENLRDDDFSVLSAATGAEAMEMLGQSRPDVVLLGVVLPDMSGYDICRLVRAGDGVNDPWDPDLPIIMLSAKAEHVGPRPRARARGRRSRCQAVFDPGAIWAAPVGTAGRCYSL